MDKVFGAVVAALLVAVLTVVVVILGTLAGALIGWIVGWFFSDTILFIAAQLGIKNISMWQLGAFLGFVGGFFRTTIAK